MNFLARIWNWILALPRRYQIGGGIVAVVVIVLGIHVATRSTISTAASSTTPHVHVASVDALASESGPLNIIGTVASLNQATLLAQVSGQIVTLNAAIGTQVSAGQVIGSFENASEVAAVQQAQGAYNAALASQSATSLPSTKSEALNAYRSAYTTLDTTLHDDVDVVFGSESAYGPQLLFSAGTENWVDIAEERQHLDTVMNDWQQNLASSDSQDAGVLLDSAYATAAEISDFVATLGAAANQTDSGATATEIASLSAARAGVDGALSAISAARDAYRSKSVGATAGADAGVEQALGALNAAKANLEKTVIRSPISGTIVSLPITLGDFVSAFSQVAEVSNPGALEVNAYVTGDDARTLAPGGAATLDGNVEGTIVSIAPALDPTTGKILVKIGITGDASQLTDGDTVTVSLARSVITKTPVSSTITLPIVATKITPQGPVVFTIASSTLAAQSITLGPIVGDRVTVASGLVSTTEIVTDARGLTDGETVIVDAP